jgi:hypothetical protein
MLTPRSIWAGWFFIALLYLGGCKCPPDTALGDLFLDATIVDQIPYRGDEVLFFANQEGDTMRFSSFEGIQEDSVHLNVAQQCAHDLFDVQHLFYHSNQYEIRFQDRQNPAHYLTLRWNMVPIDTAGDASVPAHLVGYMTLDSWLMDYGMKLIIDTRGVPLPPEAAYYQNADFISDTTLGNHTFQNVYYVRGGKKDHLAIIFFKPRRGVIAFQEENGQLWILDDRPHRSFNLGQTSSSVLSADNMLGQVAQR